MTGLEPGERGDMDGEGDSVLAGSVVESVRIAGDLGHVTRNIPSASDAVTSDV